MVTWPGIIIRIIIMVMYVIIIPYPCTVPDDRVYTIIIIRVISAVIGPW